MSEVVLTAADWIAYAELVRKLSGRGAALKLLAASPLPQPPPPDAPETGVQPGPAEFLKEAFELTGDPLDVIAGSILFKAYCRWRGRCKGRMLSATAFGRIFSALPGVHKRRSGGVFYQGLRICDTALLEATAA